MSAAEILTLVVAALGMLGGMVATVIASLAGYVVRSRDQETRDLAHEVRSLSRWIHQVDCRLSRIEEAVSGVRVSRYDIDPPTGGTSDPPPMRPGTY